MPTETKRKVATKPKTAASPKKKVKYIYDFGDDWLHWITFEGI